jgi:hypothetical protein
MNLNLIRKLETTKRDYDNNDCAEEHEDIVLILANYANVMPVPPVVIPRSNYKYYFRRWCDSCII